jgi:hypothetical protein
VADLPIALEAADSARLAAILDVEGKIPRAVEALGPVSDRDVVLLDGAGGLRARQLAELSARLTVLERDDARTDALRDALADVDGAAVGVGTPGATGLPDASVDRVVSFWSGFRDDLEGDLAEADRILADGGRLLVVHDYGRDDVSRLRGDLPEYGSWSRRDGWFLRNGFRVRVLHCWWTFESIEDAQSFLDRTFGAVGREVGEGLRRPRLSYNVAVYHRGRNGEPPPAGEGQAS